MNNQRLPIEDRLAQYAEEIGLGKVLSVEPDHPLACLLVDEYHLHLNWSSYINEGMDALEHGRLPIYQSKKEIQESGKIGVYTPSDTLREIQVSPELLFKWFGVDVDHGLSLINSNVGTRESRLVTQLHETTHARDCENGIPYLFRESVEGQAYEVLTDVRTLLFSRLILPEYALRQVNPNKTPIRSCYIGINGQNIGVIDRLNFEYNPRTEMKEVLENLLEHLDWTHGYGVQDLLLKAPAFYNDYTKDKRREGLRTVLNRLITLEERSSIPQIVPEDISMKDRIGGEND